MLKHTIQVQSNNAAFTNTATARDMLLNSAAVQYALHLLTKINCIVLLMYSLATACILLSRTVVTSAMPVCIKVQNSLSAAQQPAALREWESRRMPNCKWESLTFLSLLVFSCTTTGAATLSTATREHFAHILSGTRSRARALTHIYLRTLRLFDVRSRLVLVANAVVAVVVVVFWNDSGPYNKPAAQPANQSETRWVRQRTDVYAEKCFTRREL